MPRIAASFRIPALLAVSVIAAMPSCRDEESGDEGLETDTSDPEACDGIAEEAACEASQVCEWDGVCHLHCPNFEDEASCMMQSICYWTAGACDYGGV
jgi:hypothetical protein